MWAGIGDTYAKYYEATISSRGEQLEHFTSLGVALSVMCRNPLLEYGAKALEDHKKGLCTYDVEQVVLAIVVTTGIASIFLTKDFTPDYNSGLAHAIFYALTSYPVIEEKHLHGEVVGFGVLFALLVDQQYEEFEKIYTLNQQLQLPTSLEQIEITEEQWAESINRIPEMSDIRHYPYKVTPEMLTRAMQQLKEREPKDNEIKNNRRHWLRHFWCCLCLVYHTFWWRICLRRPDLQLLCAFRHLVSAHACACYALQRYLFCLRHALCQKTRSIRLPLVQQCFLRKIRPSFFQPV